MRSPAIFGAVFTLILCPTIVLASSDQRAFLDLSVNLVEKGQIVAVIRPNDILVRLADLQSAGLSPPSGKQEILEGEIYISLASLNPAVSYSFDEKALSLNLTAASNLLSSNIRDFRATRPANLIYTRDTSIFLNYSISARDLQLNTRDFSAFSEIGLASQNSLLYSSFSRSSGGNLSRGLTNFTLNNRKSLNRWVIGDTFTQMGNLGGNPLIGGISFSRDFSLDPYLLTTQPFGLQGALTTPSTVEVYTNGVLLRREELPPGPFEIKNVPIAAGNSNTRLVIRDAFGREQTVTTPFYFSPGLLQRGLSDYSFNLGFTRESLNESFKYDSLVFLGRYRQGLTDSLTAGMRLEAASNLINAGGEMTFRTPFGTLELAGSASSGEGLSGYAGLVGYSYISSGLSVGAAIRKSSRHYANSSLSPTEERALLETSLQVAFPVGQAASVTAQYATTQGSDKSSKNRLAVSSNIRLNSKLNLFISASRDTQEKHRVDNSLYLGLSYLLNNHTTASASYENRDDRTTLAASVEKPLGSNTGFGYRLRSQTQSDVNATDATLLYQTNFGRYEFNYNRTGEINSTLLNVSGGIVRVGDSTFLSRPLENSYALVKVPGIQGVRVYLNNNEVGKTDARGNLVVTDLSPYYSNRISIASEDIPLNYNIETTEKNVAVPTRAGGVVEFKLVKVQNFIGTLTIDDASGQSRSPTYGDLKVKVGEREVQSPLGKLGEFYLENIPPGIYSAEVSDRQGVCNFDIKIPALSEQFVDLGSLHCKAKAPQ